MRIYFLAVALWLGCLLSLAQADYVLIIARMGLGKDNEGQSPGGPGMGPGMPGMGPGMPGMRPGCREAWARG